MAEDHPKMDPLYLGLDNMRANYRAPTRDIPFRGDPDRQQVTVATYPGRPATPKEKGMRSGEETLANILNSGDRLVGAAERLVGLWPTIKVAAIHGLEFLIDGVPPIMQDEIPSAGQVGKFMGREALTKGFTGDKSRMFRAVTRMLGVKEEVGTRINVMRVDHAEKQWKRQQKEEARVREEHIVVSGGDLLRDHPYGRRLERRLGKILRTTDADPVKQTQALDSLAIAAQQIHDRQETLALHVKTLDDAAGLLPKLRDSAASLPTVPATPMQPLERHHPNVQPFVTPAIDPTTPRWSEPPVASPATEATTT